MIVHKACFFHIFQSMSRTLEGLLQEEAVQNESVERTQAHVLSLNKDILSQEEKLNRASKQVWPRFSCFIFSDSSSNIVSIIISNEFS